MDVIGAKMRSNTNIKEHCIAYIKDVKYIGHTIIAELMIVGKYKTPDDIEINDEIKNVNIRAWGAKQGDVCIFETGKVMSGAVVRGKDFTIGSDEIYDKLVEKLRCNGVEM